MSAPTEKTRQRLRQAVEWTEAQRQRRDGTGTTPTDRTRRVVPTFAKITGNTAIDSGAAVPTRWVYDITLLDVLTITASGGVPSALGSTDSGEAAQALNLAEWAHSSDGGISFGIDTSAGDPDYPAGFAPRPIGSAGFSNGHAQDVIVELISFIIASDSTRFWIFDRMGVNAGTCEAPE